MGTTENLTDENIDKAYDALLKAGDGEKLAEDEAARLSGIMEEFLSDDDKLMRDIESGNIQIETADCPESINAKVTIDPFSGKGTKIDLEDDTDIMSLDDILDNGGIMNSIDYKEIEYSESAIAAALKTTYKIEISDNEISALTAALIKATKGEPVKYNDLPPSIKSKIANTIMAEKGSIYTGNLELKNQMAKIFVDALMQEVMNEEIKEIFVDLQDSIKSIAQEGINSVYGNAYSSQRDILENDLLKIANEIESENPEKAKLLRNMHHAYQQSYKLEEMLNTYITTGKCKIKKYDLEKVDRVYEGFNRKYEKSKWVVRDVSMLEPVLSRKLSQDFNINHIRAFLIVFCKYTMNMNPDESLVDHTFMYYFIMNILNLDIFDPENENDVLFYNTLVETIENFINKIREKAKI